MNTEQEKLRASIEALEQMLGLIGNQNDTDANWANYLLSIADKQKRSETGSRTNCFSEKFLTAKRETDPTNFKGVENRTGHGRRRNNGLRLEAQNIARNGCRRVNRDRRKMNLGKKFMGLS